jgi:23S rRNA (cytidine1920-2'-O)/16S rRNA (cytidine1409-2'-O)-methyltransferase
MGKHSKLKKTALDKILIEKGLAENLEEARPLIMAAKVIVNDHMIDKPGTLVDPQSTIRIRGSSSKFVSRGGEKIEAPIETFKIDLKNKTVIDVGSSTGGFTDCVLQKGAGLVYAVDVGYGQLAWKLQQDVRVKSFERKNIRDLKLAELDRSPDLAVIDASFISLKKILPKAVSLLNKDGEILALIKPQFEAKKEDVETGGIVRDKRLYREIIKDIVEESKKLSLIVAGIMESPIKGQKGNREFFIYLKL